MFLIEDPSDTLPALFIPLLAKLAPSIPNNILRNPPFCSFASF